MYVQEVGGGYPVIQAGTGGHGYGDGFGGGWMGMLLVIALLGGGRGFGGFGGFGGACGGAGVVSNIGQDFMLANLNTNMDSRFNSLQNNIDFNATQRTLFDIDKTVLATSAATNQNINNANYANALGQKDLVHTIDNCCCSTNRNIDALRFEAAKNTCDIITAGHCDADKIIATLNHNKMEAMEAKIFEQGQALSEARIISAMKPEAAKPAYIQPSPYQQYQAYPVYPMYPQPFNNFHRDCGRDCGREG